MLSICDIIKMNLLDCLCSYHSVRTKRVLSPISVTSGTKSHSTGCVYSSSKMYISCSNLFSVTIVICVILCSLFPCLTGSPTKQDQASTQALVRLFIYDKYVQGRGMTYCYIYSVYLDTRLLHIKE